MNEPNALPVRLGDPARVTVVTERGTERLAYHPDRGARTTEGVHVAVRQSADGMHIVLTAPSAAVKYVRVRWARPMPVRGRYLADDWERSYGTLGFEGMRPNRIMPWYFLVADDGGADAGVAAGDGAACAGIAGDIAGADDAVVAVASAGAAGAAIVDDADGIGTSGRRTPVVAGYGVRVRPNALCFWQADSAGLSLEMDVRNGGAGVRLGDEPLDLAVVVARAYRGIGTFEAARRFCRVMCDDPLLPGEPVYGSNNWYYAYGVSSADDIVRDAAYLAALTEGNAVRPYMVIDDGWQSNHRLDEYNGGPWRAGNAKFPDMAELAGRIAEQGVRPGIWVRLLLNEDPAIPGDWRLPNGCLDPTHPGALAYIREDIDTLCQWGYRLIKHDFSTYDLFGRWGFQMNPWMTAESDWHYHDRSLTAAQVVKRLYEAILEAARPYGALILGCNTIGHLGAGLMHIARTGDDTSGLDWERTRRNGVNTLAFRLPQHNTFFELDADCVGVSERIDWRFNRQWADLVARTGTSFFFSAAPHTMPDAEERDLIAALRVAAERPSRLRPLDWEWTDCPETWGEDPSESDADGAVTVHYDWYDDCGINYTTTPKRYASYLAFDE
ncbi:glycoside hydrolase family 36 protein [Bifidobacterium phasiani]|uniref:Alpha-galactosidase n=1 Tax=Bifidobacterium phasiani TaxID=2834431 RepID=A0ABS6W926_9BIFI|nr:glycoside hydrolase family 36 protein [Bifidobacterium phasiani]MBW3082246.1 alpha-galactosidase [Bifidobacterium phasiani]